MYTPVLKTQAQTFVPTKFVQLQVKQVKELTCEQLVFTIINSEIARFKREKVNVDAKTVRESYQAFYAGWTQPQLMQAAMNVVQIYDKTTKIWRLVIDNKNPLAVIMCENKSCLKQPWIAKETQTKLWYVGGNNIAIIDNIDESDLSKPIYYSCDWDLAGLQIFSRIKAKLEKRKKKIHLLFPNEPHKRISTYIPYHKSHWDLTKTLSGLVLETFTIKELELIKTLIDKEEWIEEESFDIVKMIKVVL